MKKNIKNANMVEIANARIMSIYESIMSEGILGALGGAAIGSALGAGAGALGGDAFKGTDLVKGANSKFDAVATAQDKLVGAQDSLAHANRMANSAQKTANLAHTIASNPVEVAGSFKQIGDTHASIAKAALDAGKKSPFSLPAGATDTINPNTPTAEIHDMVANQYHSASAEIEKTHTSTDPKQPTLNDIAANADAELAKSKQAVTNAQKEVENKMTAVKDAKNNISAFDKAVKWSGDNPIAAGAAVGGTVGGAIGAFAHDDDRKDEGDDEVLEDDDRLF